MKTANSPEGVAKARAFLASVPTILRQPTAVIRDQLAGAEELLVGLKRLNVAVRPTLRAVACTTATEGEEISGLVSEMERAVSQLRAASRE